MTPFPSLSSVKLGYGNNEFLEKASLGVRFVSI